MQKKQKRFLWNSRTISIISSISFITSMFIMLASNRYMDACVENEAMAQKNRLELRTLGETLADASDYLTDEVRKYAITGDIEHLYNYWYEVETAKTRDIVIDTLTSYNPPQNEQSLLEEAKKYSDLLISTETISMKLVLLSENLSVSDFTDTDSFKFIDYVMDYPLPDEYAQLDNAQMADKAREILFDENYTYYKQLIMTPIEEFQSAMNLRLDAEVAQSTDGRQTASIIQILFSGAVIILIGMLLIVIHKFYISPLKDYTKDLSGFNLNENDGIDFGKIRVIPKGSFELMEFGRLFNRLALVLQNELEVRKQAELKMRAAKDEADKANNAKSDFLARMSHELRTPLNAIIGYLFLLMKTDINDNQKRYCEKIGYSSESLLSLISDILDFSKIESGNIQFEIVDFNLTGIIKEVCGVMENEIRQKQLRFIINIDGDLPKIVKGDPTKLKQVLINLLGNALKFTNQGSITLSANLIGKYQGISSVEFSVEDTGIGIRDEDKARILEPFVQSDAGVTRKYGGTGLGLAICNMIVKEASQDRFEIEISSKISKGSRFRFIMDFPDGNTDLIQDNQGDDDIANNRFSNDKYILLVDDSDINLAMESEILNSFGFSVKTAQSGMEAIAYASAEKFDMILMDIRMPDMDGYEAATKIRRIPSYKYVPIIALSADAIAGVSETALRSGMNDYAAKPLKPQKLYKLMKKYFDIAAYAPETLVIDDDRYFSSKECLLNLNNNRMMLCKLIGRFLESQKNSAEFISMHINKGNYKNASRILHDIIGLSGNLCCHMLYEKSVELKSQLASENADSLEEFIKTWDVTFTKLSDYLKANAQTERCSNDKSFDEILPEFIKKCRDYDISAADLFDAYHNQFKGSMNQSDYDALKSEIEKYNFNPICQIAEKYLNEK